MKLKLLLTIACILLFTVLFTVFKASIEVWWSFLLSAAVIGVLFIYHLFFEHRYSPFLSAYLVFSMLFFLVAPMVQINAFTGANPQFMQQLPYNPYVALRVNIYITGFNLIFFLAYLFFKNQKKWNIIKSGRLKYDALLPMQILIITAICFLFFVVSFSFVLEELRRPNWMPFNYSIAKLLVYKKVLFMLPLAGVVLCVEYVLKSKKKLKEWGLIIFMMIFLFVLLFWFKNPLIEKRNALGPLYFCVLYLFIPKVWNSNAKTMAILFFSMIILFPLSAVFTHSDATLAETIKDPFILFEQMKGGGITNAFSTLNYDAFANFMATIDYVEDYGHSMGYQLLSALLFFIPRAFWTSKPYGSGQLVGDHLIDKYDFNFNNLSNPYISEGYLNFGFFGTLIAAVILAYVVVYFMQWIYSSSKLKQITAFYFAMHLLFLLRGDFANGYSYFIGIFIGIYCIPKLIQFICKIIYNRYGT